MTSRLITLTTDFGWGSYYVSQMKGAIYLRNPDAQVVDLSHDMLPHDVAATAYWINRATRLFPADTIHVVVVDPGVGTRRDLVYCRTRARTFLAPDNGVLTSVAAQDGVQKIVRLSNAQLFHADVSKTFHGRDILAPVAAKLSLGASPQILGEPLDGLQELEIAQPEIRGQQIIGAIAHVDRFGNLISNIPRALIQRVLSPQTGQIEVRIGNRQIKGLSDTYGEQAPQTVVAIFDSDGFLEVAVVNGSAAKSLVADVGDPIRIS